MLARRVMIRTGFFPVRCCKDAMPETVKDFVRIEFPGVKDSVDPIAPLREVPQDTKDLPIMTIDEMTDIVNNDYDHGPNILTHERNVVAPHWKVLLNRLGKVMESRPSGAASIRLPTEIGEAKVVRRDHFNQVFEWSYDDHDARKSTALYVRAYRVEFEEPAFEMLDISRAVRSGPGSRFSFEVLAEKDDPEYLYYFREARAKSRAFLKVMAPIVKLIEFLHENKLYLNSMHGVSMDAAGNVTMSRLEHIDRVPTMDIDTVCALALYDDLTRSEGDKPYDLLWKLYASSPLAGIEPLPMYKPAIDGIDGEEFDDNDEVVPEWALRTQEAGGSNFAAWSALAAIAFMAAALK